VDFIWITYYLPGTICHKTCGDFLLTHETDLPKECTLVRSVMIIIWFLLVVQSFLGGRGGIKARLF